MNTVIEIPEELRRYSDGESSVAVSGATVALAFAALFDRFPELQSRIVDENGAFHPWILVFLNGRRIVTANAGQTDLNGGNRIEVAVLASGG